jgi:hypothetical protein
MTYKFNSSTLVVALVLMDIFTIIGPDSLAYAILGLIGSMIGSLVRIIRRDEADIENKVNFLYLKDIFVIFTWSLAGGFFPIVFAAQGWPPLLAVICSPFMPRFWDVMETYIPQILKSVLEKFYPTDDGKKKKEIKEITGTDK